MRYQVLTGDCLAEQFQALHLDGKVIVSRECLVEGPTQSTSLQDFWAMRAAFIQEAYQGGEAAYYQKVAREYNQLLHLPAESEVYLWFEFDLFCQVNLWFSLWLLRQSNTPLKIYRVFPATRGAHDRWQGFGDLDAAALRQCFENRVLFSEEDLFIGAQLWQAYSQNNMTKLRKLSLNFSPCFLYLNEVCEAHIERLNGRLERTLKSIIEEGITDFKEVFVRFFKREGIYGLGDLQVRKLYEQLKC
jgi:hypothetical protein